MSGTNSERELREENERLRVQLRERDKRIRETEQRAERAERNQVAINNGLPDKVGTLSQRITKLEQDLDRFRREMRDRCDGIDSKVDGLVGGES